MPVHAARTRTAAESPIAEHPGPERSRRVRVGAIAAALVALAATAALATSADTTASTASTATASHAPASRGFETLRDGVLVLFGIIALGELIGRVRIGGLSLGSSAVLFVALAAGHLGFEVPSGIGRLGIVLFVYCVGITAGPSFFRAFGRQGKSLAKLGVAIVGVGAVASWTLANLLDLPRELTVGIFAGALTSTPGLAAGLAAVAETGSSARVAVGYGLAYPFGVVAVVLFVQLLPRLLNIDIGSLRGDSDSASDKKRIAQILVEIANPAVLGKRLTDLDLLTTSNCQVSRVLSDQRLVPIPPDLILESGQHLLVVGRQDALRSVIDLLGRRSRESGYFIDDERESMRVVASSRNIVGRSLRELKLMSYFGVTVSRITRHDQTFVPRSSDVVEHGDMLEVVGEPVALRRFAAFGGHRARTFDETSIFSLAVGLVAGIVLGQLEFAFAGESFSLGLTGGPLFVALLLGHFGHIGPVTGHLPRASRLLLTEIGLLFFLVSSGVSAGSSLLPVVQEYGALLCVVSAIVAVAPLAAGFLYARQVLHMDFLSTVGGICGGMTSTPALGVLTTKTESDVPVQSYAAAYPVALIFMTVLARLLASALAS